MTDISENHHRTCNLPTWVNNRGAGILDRVVLFAPGLEANIGRKGPALTVRQCPSEWVFNSVSAHVVVELEQLKLLNHALEESVTDPEKGWGVAETYFPDALLVDLLGISAMSLRRYKEGERETPNEVAARLHWLLITALDLSKSYNPRGVQNWFNRPRTKLKNKAPVQYLKGGKWHSEDKNIQAIRDLARGSIFADGAQ